MYTVYNIYLENYNRKIFFFTQYNKKESFVIDLHKSFETK